MCVKDENYQLPIPWKKHELNNNFDVASNLKMPVSTPGRGLPHRHVMKKNGPIRPVFDCASRYRGYCLNDTVRQVPTLISTLSLILLRFCLHSYAVTADIDNMYSQVLDPMEDLDAVRFLWGIHNDRQYRMKTYLFEGVWYLSASTFALQRYVNQTHSSLVKHAIINSFYVDDLAISVQSKSDVKCVINELKKIILSKVFNMKKYRVNDTDLVSTVPDSDRYMGTSTLLLSNGECNTLGLLWDVRNDVFHFEHVVHVYTKLPCCRSLLQFLTK